MFSNDPSLSQEKEQEYNLFKKRAKAPHEKNKSKTNPHIHCEIWSKLFIPKTEKAISESLILIHFCAFSNGSRGWR